MWKREVSEERWREGCDVMRENDTISVLSLFFCRHTDGYDYWNQNGQAMRDMKCAFYPRITYEEIEEALRRDGDR